MNTWPLVASKLSHSHLSWRLYPGEMHHIAAKVTTIAQVRTDSCGSALYRHSLFLFSGFCNPYLYAHRPLSCYYILEGMSQKAAPLEDLLSGLKMKTEKAWAFRQQHPLYSLYSPPVKVRGWRHHPKSTHPPKRGDHLFFSCENF